MFRRLKNLWRWSGVDPYIAGQPRIISQEGFNKALDSIIKDSKRLATIVEDKPEELFPDHVETD